MEIIQQIKSKFPRKYSKSMLIAWIAKSGDRVENLNPAMGNQEPSLELSSQATCT
jgi:hypothetical protein